MCFRQFDKSWDTPSQLCWWGLLAGNRRQESHGKLVFRRPWGTWNWEVQHSSALGVPAPSLSIIVDLASVSTSTVATNLAYLSALCTSSLAHFFSLGLTLALSYPLSHSFPTWHVLSVYIFLASVPTNNSMTIFPVLPIQFPEREESMGETHWLN